jgi:hypothetical protein
MGKFPLTQRTNPRDRLVTPQSATSRPESDTQKMLLPYVFCGLARAFRDARGPGGHSCRSHTPWP